MSGFQMPITINQAMQYIATNYYVLPAFQRDFVWTAEQIEKLFDSLMRGYPTSSMLFWSVKGDTRTSWNFYKFISSHIKGANDKTIINELYPTATSNDFYAVLDGQQRLTAMRIGLFGSYAYHEKNQSWSYSPKSFPNRTLYLCLSRYGKDDEEMRYLFDFKKDSITNKVDIYNEGTDVWFRVGHITDLSTSYHKYVRNHDFGEIGEDILDRLYSTIYTDQPITYYLEEEQNPDKAVNIFTRINSGGTHLSFSDIVFSLMVSNWSSIDAKTEIKNLQEMIIAKGFEIDKEYIVKAFLYLYNNSVKTEIKCFDKPFCATIENNWNTIRDCITETFDLLRSFGLNNYTLTSKNATLPIVYYLYHTGKHNGFSTSVQYKNDRAIIKQWLIRMLVRRVFGASTDSVLTQTRKAFTSDISKNKMESHLSEFPSQAISDNLKNLDSVDDEFLEKLLDLQKDDKYAFSILALLYPNLDYKNNDFHKDHLHPEDRYEELSDDIKAKYSFKVYNSIRNLQMLDANENESKGKMLLKDWIEKQTDESERKSFLERHLIPDVDLSMDNFEEFITERSKLLKSKLASIL